MYITHIVYSQSKLHLHYKWFLTDKFGVDPRTARHNRKVVYEIYHAGNLT